MDASESLLIDGLDGNGMNVLVAPRFEDPERIGAVGLVRGTYGRTR